MADKPGDVPLRNIPATFEERGVGLPFASERLQLARVRRTDRGQLEMVLPNFADTNALYVVPWTAIPDLGGLTLADRLLHREVIRENATTPFAVRRLWLTIAESGAAGADARERAEAALVVDRTQHLTVSLALVVASLRLIGRSPEALSFHRLDQIPGLLRDRVVADALQEVFGLNPPAWYHSVTNLGEALAPVGLANSDPPARFRQLLRDLSQFQRLLRDWSTTVTGELRALVAFIIEVAEHTRAQVQAPLARLDDQVRDVEALVDGWVRRRADITDDIDRISWLLDGWEPVIALWDEATTGPDAVPAETLDKMVRHLPILPSTEYRQVDETLDPSEPLRRQRRFVRLYEDWRTGREDTALLSLIEKSRTDPSRTGWAGQ